MFTFNPGDMPKSSQDFVTALMEAIADPKASKALLDQINAATAELARQREKLVAQGLENRAANDADVAVLTARHEELDKREAALARVDSAIAEASDRENGANQAISNLKQLQTAHDQREKDLTAREVALAAREDRADKTELDLTKRKQEAEAAEADYRNRMTQLKALVG